MFFHKFYLRAFRIARMRASRRGVIDAYPNRLKLSHKTIKIEVRGMPNGIFNPWVRWDTWPGPAQKFFRRRRRRPRRPPCLGKSRYFRKIRIFQKNKNLFSDKIRAYFLYYFSPVFPLKMCVWPFLPLFTMDMKKSRREIKSHFSGNWIPPYVGLIGALCRSILPLFRNSQLHVGDFLFSSPSLYFQKIKACFRRK